MDELYDFLVQLKELDLYGYVHSGEQCCKDGSFVDSDCSCDTTTARSDMCAFDYCFTWDELNNGINWFFGEWENGNLYLDLPTMMMGMFTVLATMGTNLFPDRDDTFWTRVGQIGAIMTGSIASYNAG